MQYRRSIMKEAAWPAICIMLVFACCSGCLLEPPRNLTIDEVKQLQQQMEYTYSLPQDQQGLAQKQVECNRESMEKKDWHTGDFFLDTLSVKKSRCESFQEATESAVKMDNRGAVDAVIDQNLKDALDQVQK